MLVKTKSKSLLIEFTIVKSHTHTSQWDPWNCDASFEIILKSGSMFIVEILNSECNMPSVKRDLLLDLLMFIVENACSQIYVDPKSTIILKTNLFMFENFSLERAQKNLFHPTFKNVSFSAKSLCRSISSVWQGEGDCLCQ